MNKSEGSNLANAAPPDLLAEVVALRDRIQIQHGLIEHFLRHTGAEKGRVPITIEVSDPLPLHPRRSSNKLDQSSSMDKNRDAEPEAVVVHAIPKGLWWPTEEYEPIPLVPMPGWALYSMRSRICDVVGFTLFGMSKEAIEQSVNLISRAQRQLQSFVPVFLTDASNFEIFQTQGYTVEYIPEMPADDHRTEAWKRYSMARGELLRRKWSISRIFEFGRMLFQDSSANVDLFSALSDDRQNRTEGY